MLASKEPKARDAARELLLQRTATVWNDFGVVRHSILVLKRECDFRVPSIAVDRTFALAFEEEVAKLKTQLQDGVIDIPANAPEDGDVINLTFIAHGPETTIGPLGSLKMRIEIRDYRVRTTVTDSLMFIRRRHAIRDVSTPKPFVRNDHTFKPAPGVTIATTFHFRDLKWVMTDPGEGRGADDGYYVDRKSYKRFLGALSPGVGVNASLINFKEATECTGQPVACRVADGSSFQLGVGPTFTLFNGALQFTYGWNLSVNGNPSYVGVGFSFLQLIEKGAKLAKQSRANGSYGK